MRSSTAIVLAFAALVAFAACTTGGDATRSRAPTVAAGPLDPELVALGAPLYAARCASCHGASGEGTPDWRTPGVDGVLPPPPHDSTGHTWHHADGLLYRIIQEGCAVYQVGSTPCGMPAFGDQFDDPQIRAVIEFMRSWWGPDERAFQQEVTKGDPFR